MVCQEQEQVADRPRHFPQVLQPCNKSDWHVVNNKPTEIFKIISGLRTTSAGQPNDEQNIGHVKRLPVYVFEDFAGYRLWEPAK